MNVGLLPCILVMLASVKGFGTKQACPQVFEVHKSCLGELAKQIFGKSWEFGPTGLTPPPLPVRWDSKKGKKICLFCILGYFKHLIFS